MSQGITQGSFVTIEYSLRDARGNLIEETPSGEPYQFVFGVGALVPGLEAALEGAQTGDVLNVTIPPEDAYGPHDPTNVFEVDLDEFPEPEEVEVGSEFVAEGDDGTTLTMHVTELRDDHAVVDANHPLAGQTLNFQVRVRDVRPATEDELLAARAETGEFQAPAGEPS